MHTTLGRWLTRDPIGEAAGSSLYDFVANSTPNNADPTGLQPSGVITIDLYFSKEATKSDRKNAQKSLELLNKNLEKCKVFCPGYNVHAVANEHQEPGSSDPDTYPEGGDVAVLYGNYRGGGITMAHKSRITRELRIPHILSHELGHQGDYRNVYNPGPKPIPGTNRVDWGDGNPRHLNPNHSGDRHSLMWPIARNQGKISPEWCAALARIAK